MNKKEIASFGINIAWRGTDQKMKQGYHTNEDRRSTIVRKSSLPSYYGKNNVTHSEHNNFKLMGEFLFQHTCIESQIASISITSSRSISKLLPLHSRNLLVKRNSVNMRGKGAVAFGKFVLTTLSSMVWCYTQVRNWASYSAPNVTELM